MEKSFSKLLEGYQTFKQKYAQGDNTVMQQLAYKGQKPQTMIVSCCDSRVDPALLLQTDPGDLFVVRNVANIVPPFEKDKAYHGTSAALEFGICYLKVKHLILLGHSQCGGVQALLDESSLHQNDFISKWVKLVESETSIQSVDEYAQHALTLSYENCLSFPWIKERIDKNELSLRLWFFNIHKGEITQYSHDNKEYQPLK